MAEGNDDRKIVSWAEGLCSELRCPACHERKELRKLPCEHAICLTCLDNVVEADQSAEGPKCPQCETLLEKRPEDYRVLWWAEKFRENVKNLTKDIDNGKCQIKDCTQQMERYCLLCERHLCHMHDRHGPCQSRDDDHMSSDIGVLAINCRGSIERWKDLWQKKFNALKNERDELIQQMRGSIDALHVTGNSLLCSLAEEHLPCLSAAQARLEIVEELVYREQEGFQILVRDVFSRAETDARVIAIVKALDIYESRQKRSLGNSKNVISGRCCYDIRTTQSGQMVVGVDGGLLVLNKTTGEQIDFHEINHHIFAFEFFEDKLLLGVSDEERSATKLILMDSQLSEIKRWPIHKPGLDLTIVEGKVFLSKLPKRGESDEDIMVYDIKSSTRLPNILYNGAAHGLAGIPPHSILVSDLRYDCLKKYKIMDGKRWSILWTRDIIEPHATVVDSQGLIWVQSKQNNCITVLSKRGNILQEISDDRLTQLQGIHGIFLHMSTLWLSHDNGLTSFKILRNTMEAVQEDYEQLPEEKISESTNESIDSGSDVFLVPDDLDDELCDIHSIFHQQLMSLNISDKADDGEVTTCVLVSQASTENDSVSHVLICLTGSYPCISDFIGFEQQNIIKVSTSQTTTRRFHQLLHFQSTITALPPHAVITQPVEMLNMLTAANFEQTSLSLDSFGGKLLKGEKVNDFVVRYKEKQIMLELDVRDKTLRAVLLSHDLEFLDSVKGSIFTEISNGAMSALRSLDKGDSFSTVSVKAIFPKTIKANSHTLFLLVTGDSGEYIKYSDDCYDFETITLNNNHMHEVIERQFHEHLVPNLDEETKRNWIDNHPMFTVTDRVPIYTDKDSLQVSAIQPIKGHDKNGKPIYVYHHPLDEGVCFTIYEPESPPRWKASARPQGAAQQGQLDNGGKRMKPDMQQILELEQKRINHAVRQYHEPNGSFTHAVTFIASVSQLANNEVQTVIFLVNGLIPGVQSILRGNNSFGWIVSLSWIYSRALYRVMRGVWNSTIKDENIRGWPPILRLSGTESLDNLSPKQLNLPEWNRGVKQVFFETAVGRFESRSPGDYCFMAALEKYQPIHYHAIQLNNQSLQLKKLSTATPVEDMKQHVCNFIEKIKSAEDLQDDIFDDGLQTDAESEATSAPFDSDAMTVIAYEAKSPRTSTARQLLLHEDKYFVFAVGDSPERAFPESFSYHDPLNLVQCHVWTVKNQPLKDIVEKCWGELLCKRIISKRFRDDLKDCIAKHAIYLWRNDQQHQVPLEYKDHDVRFTNEVKDNWDITLEIWSHESRKKLEEQISSKESVGTQNEVAQSSNTALQATTHCKITYLPRPNQIGFKKKYQSRGVDSADNESQGACALASEQTLQTTCLHLSHDNEAHIPFVRPDEEI